MRKTIFFLFAALTLFCLGACYSDDGNYNYLSDDQISKIVFDTTGMTVNERMALEQNMKPGESIQFAPKIKYDHPERLRYSWFYLTLTNYSYQPVQVGNKQVYPPADTISHELALDWTCDLKPGQYKFYCLAEDTVSGERAYYTTYTNYTKVESMSSLGGLYLLTERNGGTDIEVYQSPLMLIYGDSCIYRYYSKLHGTTLKGTPRFIRGTTTGKTPKDGYLVATSENLYRLSKEGLMTVNDWNSMFYATPEKFDPQNSFFTNHCDFLVNDGKLHVLYANKTNDRKYSAPIAGDYEAAPFLMKNTLTTWRPVENAINAWQVLYDSKHHRFCPYYAKGTQLKTFKATVTDATVDANSVPGEVKAVFQGGSNQTYVITDVDGTPMLYRYQFYNVVDNGNLSADGARSVLNLSGCTDIDKATRFTANTAGQAFYYATKNAVYSFSTSSGETTSHTVYTCQPGEEVTAFYIWGSAGGGWPTSSCILWIGVWDSNKQEGKLVQYEMDVNYGIPTSSFGPMFGSPNNPVVTTGWGKIVDMTNLDAE